jgi:AcrR family transcriptional regulator
MTGARPPAPLALDEARAAPGSRAARAAETRATLFTSATTLFAERGYHATTVDDVARHAKVAKGTFFLHFATKGAVVVELVRWQVEGARAARLGALAAGGDRAPLEALEATVFMLGQQAAISRDLSRAVLAAGLENPEVGAEVDALFQRAHADLEADAKAAQAAGLMPAEIAPDVAASMLMASYLGAVLHFTTSPAPRPLVPLLRRLVAANLDGLTRTATPPETKTKTSTKASTTPAAKTAGRSTKRAKPRAQKDARR